MLSTVVTKIPGNKLVHKTLHLEGKNRKWFRRRFKKQGIGHEEWLLDPYYEHSTQCVFEQEKEVVSFVLGSLHAFFGFIKPMHRVLFLQQDFLSGYDLMLCKPSDAFYFRLNYMNQPEGEVISVGSHRVVAPDLIFSLLQLGHPQNESHQIKAICDHKEMHYGPSSLWLFREKKS